MNVISSEHAHATILEFRLCPGSGGRPTIQADDHCLCDVCEQPLRMRTDTVPNHRTRRD